MIPDNIYPARGLNALIGGLLLVVAVFFLLPVGTALYHDGLRSVVGWPLILQGLAGVGVFLLGIALRLLALKQKIGAKVIFNDQGFVLSVRTFLRRQFDHHLDWADIEEMKLIELPRGGDVLSFRLSHKAAVREGLIQPTTRQDAAKMLVRREVTLPLRLCGVSISEVVARFEASAKSAGARLEETSSFNVVVVARKVWKVTWS